LDAGIERLKVMGEEQAELRDAHKTAKAAARKAAGAVRKLQKTTADLEAQQDVRI
jgi:hypothetical protein